MVNLYFQPDEVLTQINDVSGDFTSLFLIGKLLSLFISVFITAGITFLISNRQTPWPLIIVVFLTSVLSVTEALIYGYPFWFGALAILCCAASAPLSKSFVRKFST